MAPSSPAPRQARGPDAALRRLLFAAGALLLASASGLLAVRLRRATDLPVLGTLAPFALTAQDGRAVTREALSGRLFVADFIFTRCAGVCPGMTARMAELQRRLPERVGFVSFTVDPGYDTPEVLARYAREFRAGPGWLFVTGEQRALYRLATEGFKLAAMEVPEDQQRSGGDGPFLHSSKFVLVDARSRIRGYYDSEDRSQLERLATDVRRLAD